MTLTDFLLARFAEDEADAHALAKELGRWERERKWNGPDGTQGSITVTAIPGTASDPVRVLADVEAKRRIVEEFRESEDAAKALDPDNPTPLYWQEWGTRHGLWSAVEHLAAIYADHPDYREEWKP